MAIPAQTAPSTATPGLPGKLVYLASAVSLVLGLFLGYFGVGKRAPANVVTPSPVTNPASAAASPMGGHPKLTLQQMKQLADVRASALLEKAKTDPKNASLLIQIAGIYQASHQFKEASEYFDKALKIDPANVSARTQLASCLYYSGDPDAAIQQLNQALTHSPKDANALFNLGMIKYQGKNDPAGAIAAWQTLLKTNPALDRRPMVEQLITEAKSSAATKK
jgi:cytochrome c-type biogenesis protein CcmH/NrfG